MSMSKRGRKKEKIGRGVLARCVVMCIVAAFIGSLAIPGLAAQQTRDTVNVTVNAPAYVEEGGIFAVTIDVADVTDFKTALFDLSFDSSVVNVIGVSDGSLDGETIPVSMWDFVDSETIRVLLHVLDAEGVSGAGYLAKMSFEVVGEHGDSSELGISNGFLVDKEVEMIPAEWIDDEVIVWLAQVKVNAPEKVKAGETFDATIDVDNIVDFNSGQFDLFFDSSVVNVTGVEDGSLDGETIPVDMWAFVDSETIRVLLKIPDAEGVSGAGYLAKISFDVVGEQGDRSLLDISDGLLGDKEAAEIPAEWIDDEVMVAMEHPFVTIKTDKSVYMSGEDQTITLTIENPTDESVQVKLGMGFHVYEITGIPYLYDVDLFETELFELPANFESSFDLPIAALGLPELPGGRYGCSAYLKDAAEVKISESEAKFSIVALSSSISTGAVPSKEMFEEISENVKQAVNAELF